nr:capsular polysaccharide biosynthesis protein [Rubellimicrobium sp. CFH 75288]
MAGYRVRLGWPPRGGLVGIWGASPTAWRGERVAERRGAELLRVEDAFLRSVLPGRAGGGPPIGLLLDRRGVHFDGRAPSDLETLLATHPLDDSRLLARARDGMARLRRSDLSKYSAHDPALKAPPPGYVLVVDQTAGDASVRASGGSRARFREMLAQARAEHPRARILVRTHPETRLGARAGHLGFDDLGEGMALHAAPVSPWRLLEGAIAVWTLSSQLGFEAILAGHRPVVLGQPFYAGWGLSDDRDPPARRGRTLTRAQLFAGAMLLAPVWYDPFADRLCPWEDAVAALEAEARAWRDDRHGWVAGNMRLWKRRPVSRVFGRWRPVLFAEGARAEARAARTGRRLMVWGTAPAPPGAVRVEDGFLRSRGLGAELVPPLSLVLDDLGLYFDPGRESRLERLVSEAAAGLAPDERERAERLIRRIREGGLSKYNLPGALPPLPGGRRRILVPGQVEDDASVRLGAVDPVRTNRALLRAAREANPDALILWKPHPDVEAGLRPGAVAPEEVALWADATLSRVGAAAAIEAAEEVWTITSTLGFEALLRGRRVVCLGRPFYAGWGLTEDRGGAPARRMARPDLVALVHAALIAYPRYHDPVTDRPCPPEAAVLRLETGRIPRPGPATRSLAKAQGAFASWAWLWRGGVLDRRFAGRDKRRDAPRPRP